MYSALMAKKIQTPEQVKEKIICYLEFEVPVWQQLRDRDERASHNDGFLAQERGRSMDRIDRLLEDLHAINVLESAGVALAEN